MNRSPYHIPFDRLADYVEGRLPVTERRRLEAHLSVCTSCTSRVNRLEHLIGLMRTDISEDAPPTLIARVKRLFRSRAALKPIPSGLHHRVLAVLHFDSVGLARAAGVRSGKAGIRQLLFSAGPREIDLRIEPTGPVWTVSGQILGESAAGGNALLQGTGGTRQAELNELSEFVLPSVEAGTYKLILNLQNAEVEIDELSVGS